MENRKLCTEYKQDIKKRLNRVEGQVRGVQKMIDEDKYCVDILTQIAAIRAAINKTGSLVLEMYSKECMQKAMDSEEKDRVFKELMDTVQKFLRFVD